MINNFRKQLQFVVFIVFSFFVSAAAVANGSYEAFFRAIQRDDVRALTALQQMGFDLNSPSPDLQPPLHVALAAESWRAAGFLIAQDSVDVEARSTADETPIMIAALKGRLDLVRQLIERRAQVNKPGWTPLHYAATYSGPEAPEITRLMLEHHAYINAESPNGSTPLMMAAHYGHETVVKLLLEEGADPLVRNEQGLTAIDFAHRAGRRAVAEVIGAFVRGLQPRGVW
jgi:uncharacterized protein